VALCCLLAISTAGCGPTDPSTPTPPPASQTSATPVPPAPGPQTNPIDRDTLLSGGDLRIGVPSLNPSWNPWDSSPFTLDPVLDAMTPRLFAAAANGTLHWDSTWLVSQPVVQPAVGAGGAMTVTYDLNPRAMWSDGAPITVDDFEATWQACVASPGPLCADRGFEHVTGIAGGAGANQVVVTYDANYAAWPYTFARGPSRAQTIGDHERWEKLDGRQGSFSGPYVFSSQKGDMLTLVRNPYWWGPYPKLDTISIGEVADPVLAYLRGDIDGFWVTDVNLFAQASTLAGIQVRRSTGTTSRYLVMNCASGPLAEPPVRRAVLMGLDRARLSASDLAGWKWDGTLLNSPVWVSGQTQYVDLVATTKAGFDLKTATALLDEDGWILGEDGIRSKNGVDLAWEFLIPQGDSLAENEGFGLRVLLAALGIHLDLRYVEPGQVDQLIAAGQDVMAGMTWAYTTPDSAANRFSQGNRWGYSNPTVDSLTTYALTRLDPTQHTELLNDIADLVWADAPMIPVYELPEILMVREGLANYGPDELGTVLWENVGWS